MWVWYKECDEGTRNVTRVHVGMRNVKVQEMKKIPHTLLAFLVLSSYFLYPPHILSLSYFFEYFDVLFFFWTLLALISRLFSNFTKNYRPMKWQKIKKIKNLLKYKGRKKIYHTIVKFLIPYSHSLYLTQIFEYFNLLIFFWTLLASISSISSLFTQYHGQVNFPTLFLFSSYLLLFFNILMFYFFPTIICNIKHTFKPILF